MSKTRKDSEDKRSHRNHVAMTLIEGLATLVALAFWICIGYHFITKFW